MKKIMTILAALAVALMLVGCAGLGKGFTSGTKWKKKMTVNGTSIEKTYRRFIKPLSTSTKVSAIKTKIVVDKTKSILTVGTGTNQKNVVVGLAFDFHQTGTGNNAKYDFVLIGFAPETKKFYIERYPEVLNEKAQTAASAMAEDQEDLGESGFDTDDGSMAAYKSFTGSITGSNSLTLSNTQESDDWFDAPTDSYTEDADSFEIEVQVKQTTKGTYEIYLGSKKVATYQGEVKDTDGETCIGKAAVYANSPKNTKVVATYISDKAKTTGLFVDDEDY